MAKISLDLSSIKSAGIYTIEIDESMRIDLNTISSLRLLVGFAGKGGFNRPVFLQNETQRLKIYGDIDTKLEKRGCWFNRFARILLDNGPILALNLLKVDDAIEGPDQVNYAALSLDAGSKNPVVKNAGITYGEYDYLADTLDAELYGTESGDSIPFVGKTPYSSLYDRSRFWIPSEYNLQQVAANGLGGVGKRPCKNENPQHQYQVACACSSTEHLYSPLERNAVKHGHSIDACYHERHGDGHFIEIHRHKTCDEIDKYKYKKRRQCQHAPLLAYSLFSFLSCSAVFHCAVL